MTGSRTGAPASYLDDERSGASGFQDMGEDWVKVRTKRLTSECVEVGEGRLTATFSRSGAGIEPTNRRRTAACRF
jgi:hypothetical protein